MKKQLFTRKIVAKLSGEHSAVAYASVKALVDKAVVLAPSGAENHVPITEIPVCRNRNFGDTTREARVSKRLKATTRDHLEIPKLVARLTDEREVADLRKELEKSNKRNLDLSMALASAKSTTVQLKMEVAEAKHAELHAREEKYDKGYKDCVEKV